MDILDKLEFSAEDQINYKNGCFGQLFQAIAKQRCGSGASQILHQESITKWTVWRILIGFKSIANLVW